MQPQIARSTRVCAYDRAGLGGSDPGPTPRTSATIVGELHTLLARAGIAGPYVLVGHSIAGYHIRLYAHRYPGTAVGMVLLDASHPDQIARQRAALGPYRTGESPAVTATRAEFADTLPDPYERFTIAASAAQVRTTGPLGALPLVVLTRGRPVEPATLPGAVSAGLERIWLSLQDDLARLSTGSIHVIATRSGHAIQIDQPDLVVAATRAVIAAALRHTALPACAAVFASLGGACLPAQTERAG